MTTKYNMIIFVNYIGLFPPSPSFLFPTLSPLTSPHALISLLFPLSPLLPPFRPALSFPCATSPLPISHTPLVFSSYFPSPSHIPLSFFSPFLFPFSFPFPLPFPLPLPLPSPHSLFPLPFLFSISYSPFPLPILPPLSTSPFPTHCPSAFPTPFPLSSLSLAFPFPLSPSHLFLSPSHSPPGPPLPSPLSPPLPPLKL